MDFGNTGTSIPQLTVPNFKELTLAAIYQQKLAALEALKKSLLHRAFAGELS